MEIVVITGSPHKKGTSVLLADKFIEGASAAGHEIYRFDAAFEDIHPCIGCDKCYMNGPCIHDDAIEEKLMSLLLSTDMIVLVTPLYYFGMSAQLKTVIDRFYSHSKRLTNKQSVLIATAYNSDEDTMDALTVHYEAIVNYMHWQDKGKILAVGCSSTEGMENTKWPEQAYQLGFNI